MAQMEGAGHDSLSRLIFRSRAIALAGSQRAATDVSAILRSSRANNPALGITGVMLFDGHIFIQVLEGPSIKVEELYEVIARDLRHEAIEVIDFLPAETREYPRFDLGFVPVNEMSAPKLRHIMSRAVQGAALTLCTTISEALATGASWNGTGLTA